MESLLYKRHVNKSVLWDGFGVKREYVGLFLSKTGFLKRGQKRDIKIIFEGKTYDAEIKNLNNSESRRTNDAYQIRYPANGVFAQALQKAFYRTYNYISEQSEIQKRIEGKTRPRVNIPDNIKEYIAIYTTNIKDTYICEPIYLDEMDALKESVKNQSERTFESIFNFDIEDTTASINEKKMLVRIRKLNRKIGDYLKEHYQYRCQICGCLVGEKYGSNIVEAHHIRYFVDSLDNSITNQLIVCPNHHGIIHDRNPKYIKEKKVYRYPNGLEEGFVLNDHL